MKRRHFICSAVGFSAASLTPLLALATGSGETMVIYKDPNCGCCHLWSEAMKQAGFKTEIHDTDDVAAVKKRLGVPEGVRGCHTATVSGYFVEGHVPLAAVRELLMDPHEIAGLAVPGMPSGSLGMGDDPQASYDVYSVGKDGRVTVTLQVRPKT